MRIRNKPIYLKDYITKLDLRTIPVVISHIPISRQVNEEQKSDFGELRVSYPFNKITNGPYSLSLF